MLVFKHLRKSPKKKANLFYCRERHCFLKFLFEKKISAFYLFYSFKKWKQDISDLSRQKISAEVSAMNAATAQLITLSAGDQEPDPQAVSAAIVPM